MPNENNRYNGPDVLASDKGKKPPLAGVYAGNDGGAYYVSQVDDRVYWFAEHPGRDYAHVFTGTREGNLIQGRFRSVPKDTATTHGEVKLEVQPNGSLKRIGETGGFPSKALAVVSMADIVDKLPGKRKWPGFTANTDDDLDGVFDGAHGYRCYVRQIGDTIVFFAEKDFKKGQLPEGAIVFVGRRTGSTLKGTWVAVPKGKMTGSGALTLSLGSGRTLVQATGSPLGGGTLTPLLPDIRLPIATVMELVNTQLNKVQIRLDGYGGGKQPLKDGCWVKFGSGGEPFTFTMPSHDILLSRYFINDMTSDVIHAKPLSENETRLTVLFEEQGTEIKRIKKRSGSDGRSPDWDIENPRCDIYFALKNFNTTDGRSSISYQVDRVEFLGELDAPNLIEAIDEFITKKVRPKVEVELEQILNRAELQLRVANAVRGRLDDLLKAASEYSLFGYSLSALVPKQVFLDGDSVVFRFV